MNANRQFQAPIIEERGYFWWNDAPVPERHFAPDTAVAGTLRIDDEGRIDLDLDGTLPSERNPLSQSPEEFPKNKAIRGILKGSSKHVLLSALTTSRTVLTSHGISYSGYRALYCLLGDDKISLAKLESPFHVLEFDLKGFENWLRLGSIHVDSGEDTYSVKHERPQSEAYDVGCGLVTLKFGQ